MKKNRIDKSVIMYWPNIGGTKVPKINEVLKNIRNYPNLFLASSIRITDDRKFNREFEELKNILSKKQIVGVKLYLGYEHFFANDPRCNKIYELCIKYNIPVIYHTGDTWNLKNAMVRFTNPIYIDDVAVKFPKLKILISHLGNPCWIKETAEVIYKNKNVFTDFCGTLSFPGRFEKEYNNNLKKEILELVAYCGTPRKLLFGSDFDLYKQEQYIKFLESFTEFSKTDLEYIRHKNAEKLFKI
ncbi:MAG: amidohydrolase family protein [Nanoarchaeota archaeon]|nr:amidohydrolase family protein [Nanoarchaeota archaeon]MBU4284285.1 amidohydrolase family protein [Nanoarchaeota archaeon]